MKLAHEVDLLNSIIEIICRNNMVETNHIKSNSRKKEIVQARHEVSYFGLAYTKLSSTKIGFEINKSHCTVLYSRNLIQEYIDMGLEKTYLGESFQDIKNEIEKEIKIREKIAKDADTRTEVEKLIDSEIEYYLTLK